MASKLNLAKEADKYFRDIQSLDIGKEYIAIKTGTSLLRSKTRLHLLDYIRLRRKTDHEFNKWINEINDLIAKSIESNKDESSNKC